MKRNLNRKRQRAELAVGAFKPMNGTGRRTELRQRQTLIAKLRNRLTLIRGACRCIRVNMTDCMRDRQLLHNQQQQGK